jgi:hypothetical protein
VDDGTAAADPEIAPRQQIVSGAFALRAKVAESVAGGAVTTTMIGDGQVSTGKIASSAVDSSRILDSTIVSTDIANNTITAGKLDTTTIGLWTPQGSSVYRSSGNVGIGEANPGFPLNFASSLGDKISLYGNSGNHYGFGIQGGLLQIHSDISASDIAFGYGSSASFTETMRIKGNGNVGIGINNPADKLSVNGNGRVSGILSVGSIGVGTVASGFYGDSGNIALRTPANGATYFQNYNGATTNMFITPGGNVGIGTTNPSAKLAIGGSLEGSAKSPWFNVYGGSLGTQGGSELFLGSFGCSSPNFSSLSISAYRAYTNADWPSAQILLGLNVDNSTRAGSWLSIGQTGVSVVTTNQSQGAFSVGGGLVSVGSRAGSPGYCRVRYDGDNGRFFFEGYNTFLNNGSWRGFSIDGNSDIDWQSDRRLKKDIVDAEPMLSRLMQLPFRRFQWKASTNPNEAPEFGVIAQEVEPLFPDIVGKGGDGIMTVGYTTFATIACKAIQELKVEKDDQLAAFQQKLDSKDQKITDLEARLSALEKLIQSTR